MIWIVCECGIDLGECGIDLGLDRVGFLFVYDLSVKNVVNFLMIESIIVMNGIVVRFLIMILKCI